MSKEERTEQSSSSLAPKLNYRENFVFEWDCRCVGLKKLLPRDNEELFGLF